MTPARFKKLLARDHYCLHCGETEAIAPNHRINRGMGGSKARDVPSNLVLLCSYFNGVIEANSTQAALAKRYGWKLESWQKPSEVAVYDSLKGVWWLLDDEFGRIVVNKEEKEPNATD